MIDKIESVSRRKAFSILGGAVVIGIPIAVLTASNAGAQHAWYGAAPGPTR